MTREDIKNLKLLASKKRLENANRYLMTEEEKMEFDRLLQDFERLHDSIPKAIFYMHDFLGIGHKEISKILNFSYMTVRIYYSDIVDILTS